MDGENKDNMTETGGGESFAELLEKSSRPSERLFPGQKVKADVVSISGDLVYIDLSGKSEGVIDVSEFVDKEGNMTVKAGDSIEAYFVAVQNGVRKLTTLVHGYSASSLSSIMNAFEAGVPVNGDVRREVKGGFEVSVGGVRCFCPFSQIDLRGGREGGVYLGSTFPFKVIEFGENGKNVIVSRRAILEQERQQKIEELKISLSVGMELDVTVVSLQKFGAFVDLGGIEGLIPVSELAWERVGKPSDILKVGQKVTAKIIALDWEKNRLTLSLKALQADPWSTVADRYLPDSRVPGTITRLTAFGVFVKLEPGIEGLMHISNLGAGRRISHPKEVVEAGQVVEAYVLSVDAANRKISLSLQPKVEPKKIVLPGIGEMLDGVVEKVMPFGIFVRTKSGLAGLVPNAETGTPQGTDLKKQFPSGMELKMVVTEVDSSSNKIRLSLKALQEKAAQDEYDDYVETARKGEKSSGGFGSLGDILKAKIDEKNQAN